MNGFARRAVEGTPNILHSISSLAAFKPRQEAHLSENLFYELPVLPAVESRVEAEEASAPLETITGHFELVYGVNILNMHLNAWSVGGFGCPHVEIFVPSSLEI